MKLGALTIGAICAFLCAGAASAGDSHDIYHNPYKMCKKIVKYQHRATPISKMERHQAVQYCLAHSTRYF